MPQGMKCSSDKDAMEDLSVTSNRRTRCVERVTNYFGYP
jgi:hypothetical protein